MEKIHGRHHRSGFSLAIVLIILGVLLLGFNIGLIPDRFRPVFISWEMLLIVLGAVELFRRHVVGGIVLLFIGVFFILPKLTPISGQFVQLYWPLLLILLGFVLLFWRFMGNKTRSGLTSLDWQKRKPEDFYVGNNPHYMIHKEVTFAADELVVLDSEFYGGKLNVTFGELKIDLRRTTPAAPEVVIEVNVSFGNIVFLVPADWNVKLQLNTVFGGFEDKRIFPSESHPDQHKTLIIVGSTAFGGGELRNE